MKTTKQLGTLISATMNPRDLIPAFIAAALTLANTDGERADLHGIQKRANSPGYYDTDTAQMDLEQLFDLLDAAAPSGHYFGAHPGDGSDFGFWQFDDDNDEAPDHVTPDEPRTHPED